MSESYWWMHNNLQNRFGEGTTEYQGAKLVLLGAPLDDTAVFRPGARFGPQGVRQVADGLEEYSFYQDRELSQTPFFDAGDLCLPCGNVYKSLEIIKQAVLKIDLYSQIPFLLGGEHLISWAALHFMISKYSDLRIVHLGAHAALKEEYRGEKYSSTSVMRLAAQSLGPGRIYQFGIRSGERREFEYAREFTRLFPEEVLLPFRNCLAELQPYPIYITIDIAVLDPAFAPGTGRPEAGGIRPRELFQFIRELAPLKVVGADLVEIAPNYDATGATQLLGIKIVREMLLSLAN